MFGWVAENIYQILPYVVLIHSERNPFCQDCKLLASCAFYTASARESASILSLPQTLFIEGSLHAFSSRGNNFTQFPGSTIQPLPSPRICYGGRIQKVRWVTSRAQLL